MNPADIVERLRAVNQDVTQPWKLCEEAAAEIEQLREELSVNRTALDMKHAEIERLQAKLSKAVDALKRINNENQVRYIQIGDDPNENGPTIQIDGPFAKIARATLKEVYEEPNLCTHTAQNEESSNPLAALQPEGKAEDEVWIVTGIMGTRQIVDKSHPYGEPVRYVRALASPQGKE